MSPVTADGNIAGLLLLAAAAALATLSFWPGRPRRRVSQLPVSVENRVPGAAPLQLKEAVSLGDKQHAVPQLGRSVTPRDG